MTQPNVPKMPSSPKNDGENLVRPETKLSYDKYCKDLANGGGASVNISVAKLLSKEDIDLIADATKTFFDQIDKVFNADSGDMPL